jgi:hypothetical protein
VDRTPLGRYVAPELGQRFFQARAAESLDGRRTAREQYIGLLDQFERLLSGPEEPCHKFLKAKPEILCNMSDAIWSSNGQHGFSVKTSADLSARPFQCGVGHVALLQMWYLWWWLSAKQPRQSPVTVLHCGCAGPRRSIALVPRR